MTVLQNLLLVAPFLYSCIVSIVLSMIIGYKKFIIHSKNFYIAIFCYLPIIILATIIAFVIPDSTSEGSLVAVKVVEFFAPFIWIILPIWIQISYKREQKTQNLMDSVEELESKNKDE